MKKICMITTVSGTMESFVVEIAKHVHHTCGYDVTLICDHDEAFANSLPEYLHYIPVKMERGINLSGFASIKKFRRIFRRENFDLVQYATPNASCYASIAAKRERVPVRLYCQWGIRYVGLHGITKWVFKQIEKNICKLSTHIHCASHGNMQFAIREHLYSSEKASVVGNGGTIGVDLNEYNIAEKAMWRTEIRSKYNLTDSDFVFGFAGRISVDKGCNELIAAFRAVSQAVPSAKLLIVGPFEDNCGLQDEWLSFAKASDRVVFTGRVAKGDMRKFYAAMDVLVHPTYREGFGMVIQEAGALAVPVITTKIPGASEVMKDGVSCMLVEPKNAEALSCAMESIYLSPAKALSIGEDARQRTESLYERSVMLEQQRKEYVKLLSLKQ